ncbi:LysR family transcriptional regulator [Burkholderia gladioli]|uniref:LysR family transcriptional regulator n=1 Tax=Burkholderia gladioli TaxID=28095 RepID=UPI003C7BB6B5
MLLRGICYFLAVPGHCNFTCAAEALHVSPPTLLQQIRQLGDMLCSQRLDRSGRNVQLMDADVAWMRCANPVLQALDAGDT